MTRVKDKPYHQNAVNVKENISLNNLDAVILLIVAIFSPSQRQTNIAKNYSLIVK